MMKPDQNSSQLPLFAQTSPLLQSSDEEQDWLIDYLISADLQDIPCRIESWKIEESNTKLSYLSHGFFRYFGKFPPPVAERFIRELHEPKSGPVIDPMMGSGTTLVEALIQDRHSIGMDINPLAVLVATVKTTPIERQAISAVLASYINHMSLKPKGDFLDLIPKDRYLNHWFFEETQEKLAWTRQFIDNIADTHIKNLFLVGLASNIRRFSRASNGLGRMFLDPAIVPQDVGTQMARKITEMALIVEQLFQYKANAQSLQHNAQEPLDTPKTNLVLCHPPYFNLYRYSSIYKYEMLWLGFDYHAVRPKEIREGFKIGKRELIQHYVEDLGNVIVNIDETLVAGGWCILMIGDTVIRGDRINTTSLMLRYIQEHIPKLELEGLIIRQPKFTEASYAATQRRDKKQVGVKLQDHILILRKSD